MTLLETTRANAFLAQYKRLLCAIAAKPLKIINDFSEARKALYTDGFILTRHMRNRLSMP